MPQIWPILKDRRSGGGLTLLCCLSLVAASPPGSAQEPEPANSSEDSKNAPFSSAALDAEVLSADTVAAGEASLDVVARLEAEFMLRDLVDEGRYEEAIPLAERLVELTEEELGIGVEFGVALSNLGILQRRAGLYELSEESFLRSIDVIRDADGFYTDAVINPLIGLGVNFQASGAYFDAVTIFEEARTVSRRVHGLLNEGQIEILDHLSNTRIEMEQYAEADQHQLTALHLRERIYGAESMEILPAIYKFARWLRAAYRYNEERHQYSRAMGIIREHEGDMSESMVRALRETGNSFRVQKYPEGRGISALRRALEIALAPAEPDKLMVAEILVDIGDWTLAFSKVGPTGEEYLQAWNLLGELENGAALRAAWFDEPSYVLRENPSNRGISAASEPGVLPGHVLITFDVTEFGRTTNVTVIEAVPPGLKDDSTARAINRSRFRPRIVDGAFVRVPGQARNFIFHYLPRD